MRRPQQTPLRNVGIVQLLPNLTHRSLSSRSGHSLG
jgi:hypothetical protein